MPHTEKATRICFAMLCAAALCCAARPAAASKVMLEDGRVITGKFVPIATLSKDPRKMEGNDAAPRLILMCDDDLRRTFVPKRLVKETSEADDGEIVEKFLIPQRTPRSGARVSNVGSVVKIGPFDEYGRREFTIMTDKGEVVVIQQITEITPHWTKLEGYKHIWDQRVSTASIPAEIIDQLISKRIDPKKVDHRLKVARFYLQSERYPEAEAKLQAIIKDFPDFTEQIKPVMQSLRQLSARQVLSEIRLREQAGQYQTTAQLLKVFPEKFPAGEVAGEILQEVREKQEALNARAAQRAAVLKLFADHLQTITDVDLKKRLERVQTEIAAELNFNTLDRFSAYQQLADDPALEPVQKLSLAVSGWLVGSSGASDSLAVAQSLLSLRNYASEYLVADTKVRRDELLEGLRALEGADPRTVALVLANMKPPYPLPEPVDGKAGLYQITFAGPKEEPEFSYLIQLPPEYDPYRRYPTVVTLHGGGSTPAMQLDWWAGAFDEQGHRHGQASRYGYIVIAPQWGKLGQRQYGYSEKEHFAVLGALRDASRRFSIDTDRVYLSGHSIGGDAAWDIALAHPDLWAGAIPIVGQADKFVDFYKDNAKYMPLYVVAGELDGKKLDQNANDLQQYMIRGYDLTYVEYLGRGHEHFLDEIMRIFDWMPRYKRNFFPREFECRSMRDSDNFYWWVELAEFPPNSSVDPANFAQRGKRAMPIDAKVNATNGILVRTGAEHVTVWLAPEFIDLNQPIEINVNGAKLRSAGATITPDLAIMLEDVRTRGDRQHPFWARVIMPEGKVNLASGQQ